MNSHIAIRVEAEYNAPEFWAALRQEYPALAQSLTKDGVAVIRSELWDTIASLPGFDGGPEYAPAAIIDCGSEGERWADVVACRHHVFEVLA